MESQSRRTWRRNIQRESKQKNTEEKHTERVKAARPTLIDGALRREELAREHHPTQAEDGVGGSLWGGGH